MTTIINTESKFVILTKEQLAKLGIKETKVKSCKVKLIVNNESIFRKEEMKHNKTYVVVKDDYRVICRNLLVAQKNDQGETVLKQLKPEVEINHILESSELEYNYEMSITLSYNKFVL
jgi:hypothetical protein